ncbi:EF-hand calcium-binding domain-containing protein 4A [Anolis carolinensis]|uniref:EF-hand domain-containing protein n=1 Tax=Anolis carolinensis TaxID=28377 RepID=G1KR34_ANOCA|nr:PREDICTED: EF-hand calcium-binding domain-containing protein 4A isoform X2 [Anolis carolinensis]|eukprot:XP_008106579.1 PREDICTED: EF-hand calcium-binding domain-containing protein 4A isoform X2 [Anolis carolinensis]
MERTDKQNGRFETAHGEDEDGTVSVPSSPLPLCLNNMEMLEKARELFHLCDKEGKGFITKADMQRLQCELPLTTEQLEAVFDNLEQNNNGYLTPVEFSMGLGKFIGIEQYQSSESTRHEETFESGWSDDLDQTDEEEKRFCSLLEQLDSFQVFEDQSEVQELWARLRKEQPELLGTFEELIFRISSYLKDVQQEKESMELVLKRREIDHDREIRCLYEEMEQQIKAEREQLLCQESTKQGKSSLLQKELRNKEQEFEKMLCHQKKLELQLQSQNSMQLEIRVQNERLQILNESLLDQLERSRWELEVAQGQLQHLQKEAQLEQEQKDRDVFKVSKNMQKEKKSLLRQLELLREMNKKLRDERDAFEAKKLTATERKKSQWKKGSMIGKYLVEEKPAKCQLFPGNFPLVLPEDTIMEEPTNNNCKLFPKSMTNLKDERGTNLSVKQSTASRKVTEKQKISRNSGTPRSLKSNTNRREMHEPMDLLLFPRGKPIDDDTKRSESSPDRVFKVVFLGNSGVGKSSFIHRFCYNRFLSEINSTIGIDYQVKSLMVDNMQVVLQLWDTAGQERFRSITKQYFRRVDGVLVMYDTTAECTFVAVRNWMSCAQDGVEDDAVMFLLGNKIDIADKQKPKIPRTAGERLAKEYKAVFYECSAMTGYNILEPMLHMARLLTAHEDRQREWALHLEEYNNGKGCCL